MAPKKPIVTTTVFIVLASNGSIVSVHATSESAISRQSALSGCKVEEHTLSQGSVIPNPAATPAQAPAKAPAKSKAKAKPAPVESGGEDGEDDEEEEKPAPAPKAKPAKIPTNASANKPAKNATDESSLPENVQALLNGSGDQFEGMSIVVTGVPPMLGRKNAEKLVASYGGKVVKSLSQNTRYVVVGNEAGPKKLEQISAMSIETLSEDQLIKFLEGGSGGGAGKNGAGAKRAASGGVEKAAKKKK